MALQWVIKTTQNIISTHLPSIGDISEVISQMIAHTQQLPVHHAAIWQVIQQLLPLYDHASIVMTCDNVFCSKLSQAVVVRMCFYADDDTSVAPAVTKCVYKEPKAQT